MVHFNPTNQQLYDAKQTEMCDKLREFLRSIATLSVEAQNYIGEDKCGDLLNYIESDFERAVHLNNSLCLDKIECDKCGVHLKKHDQEVCDDIGKEWDVRYILVDLIDGKEVKPGDLVVNTRNESWVYDDFKPPSAQGSDAKIQVHLQDKQAEVREFYARIFGLGVKEIPTDVKEEMSIADAEIEQAIKRHADADESSEEREG